MPPANAQHIFLTGATGFLGHYVLAELRRRTAAQITVMLSPPLARSRQRLAWLLAELGVALDPLIDAGRITLTEGRLPGRIDAQTLHGVDLVLHAAASVAFQPDADGDPMRTNVDGTAALVDASRSAGVREFLLVSTAYVCGDRRGRIAEALEPTPPRFCNPYEHSKWLAERLVVEAFGDRATICRPSILFGDRPHGRTTNFNGIYLVARATELLARVAADDPQIDRHAIPLRILGRADATCNLVPVDLAASRIVDVVQDASLRGRVHHLTNPKPPTHDDIKRWLEAYHDIGGGRFCDATWPLPDANRLEETFYSLGSIVGDYFRNGVEFDSCWNVAPGDDRLVDRSLFLRSLDYMRENRVTARRSAAGRLGRRAAGFSPRGASVQMSHDESEPPGSLMGVSCEPCSGSHARHVDPAWYFERFLPQRVPVSSVARVHALTTIARFRITAGRQNVRTPSPEWTCRFDAGQLAEVRRGPNGLAESFGFSVAREAFTAMVTGSITLQSAFFRGDVDIFGRVEQALRMVPIMSAFISEHPANRGGRGDRKEEGNGKRGLIEHRNRDA